MAAHARARSPLGILRRRLAPWLGTGYPLAPRSLARHFWGHRRLIGQLARREALDRYAGSFLGPVWTVVEPLLLLAIYVFVFGVGFRARFGGDENLASFALTMYAGLVTFYVFSQAVASAPQIVTSNPRYVTKVVFPVEILPLVRVLSTCARMLPSFGVLLAAHLAIAGPPPATAVALPVVLVPLALLALAGAYWLACLGVFVRDLQPVVALAVRLLMYVSPVLYPASQLPADVQWLMWLNPLTPALEGARGALLAGHWPAWGPLAAVTAVAAGAAWMGYAVFMRLRTAFADVL